MGNRTLVVALDASGVAEGTQYSDDGLSLDSIAARAYTLVTFTAQASPMGGTISSAVLRAGYEADPAFVMVRVLGASCPRSVEVGGVAVPIFCKPSGEFVASGFHVALTETLLLHWSYV